MRLLDEHAHGAFRLRVTDCGCEDPECETRFIFATTHEVLWVATGLTSSLESTREQVQLLLADVQVDGAIAAMVASSVALVGLTWPVLMAGSRPRVLAQMKANEDLPQWMFNMPVRDVWAARRLVFGEDLTRVPRALAALDDAYAVEGPVRKGELS